MSHSQKKGIVATAAVLGPAVINMLEMSDTVFETASAANIPLYSGLRRAEAAEVIRQSDMTERTSEMFAYM